MTVEEVYEQAKQVSADEQKALFTRLLEDIVPEPPNTFHNEDELEAMFAEAADGPFIEVTDSTWSDRHRRLRNRQ